MKTEAAQAPVRMTNDIAVHDPDGTTYLACIQKQWAGTISVYSQYHDHEALTDMCQEAIYALQEAIEWMRQN